MINSNRIVPITKVDLLSLYAAILTIAEVTLDVSESNTVDGDFEETSVSNPMICDQPVKSFNFGSSVTSATIYFIPAYSYEGFKKTGATLTVTGEVVPDGATLYKAVLSTNALTITKIGV